MTMNYEAAQIAAIANAEGFIRGLKIIIDTWDCQTGELGMMYLIAFDEDDE